MIISLTSADRLTSVSLCSSGGHSSQLGLTSADLHGDAAAQLMAAARPARHT